MQPPIAIDLGELSTPAHVLFEGLAYLTSFTLFRTLRRREGDSLSGADRWTLVVAAILGAAVGSKALHHASHPSEFVARGFDPAFLAGGKTIVGALLGGALFVELAKLKLGIRRRTGDLYALPLIVGIAIGRIGCFLAGLSDNTHGLATGSTWGVDFGDGIRRHPTQLYEIVFLILLALFVTRPRFRRQEGTRFRVFLLGYLVFRLGVDFLKPYESIGPLGGIQWAALFGILAYSPGLLLPQSGVARS